MNPIIFNSGLTPSKRSVQSVRFHWPLMADNITREDRQAVIDFLKTDPTLTQAEQVCAFEQKWSRWIGVRHSVFVNSGSSANLITLAAMAELYGTGEVIVPTLTWVSDIAAVLHAGFQPVFVDINPKTLGMDDAEVIWKLTPKTKAVFLTHVLGFNALSARLLKTLQEKGVALIEDACESHGAVFGSRRVGSFGLASNFSFYYAHHLSTIEGGMVCTNDDSVYETVRMFRSHGLVRESTSEQVKSVYRNEYADLNPEFIFAFPAFNVRNTEINAVIGLSHMHRLDQEIAARTRNLKLFLESLDPEKYRTDFVVEGSSNYAFPLVLQKSFKDRTEQVMKKLSELGVEHRRGTSGGGNQLRQPYLRKRFGDEYRRYPEVDHVHFHGFYIGNYPGLEESKIKELCSELNAVT